MPRVEFKTENKVATTNYDYPKLKLKSGERARILIGLEDPIVEYVHTLRKPQIINGVPQTFQAERKDGSKYEDYKMDFISRPLCLGDATVLSTKGSDPKNCPMCKLAAEHPDYTQPPQRRYAVHVIRYRTKGGSVDVVTPFSVETVVWSFTDKIFNKIVDFKEEWGDLRQHDLLLGPCTNESFQQFDITVAAKAAWLETPERKTLTAQTFKENQIPDLTIAAGSPKQKQWVDQDIEKILEAWGTILGAESSEDTADLDADLNGLLSDDEDSFEAQAAKESSADPDDDILADLGVSEPEVADEPEAAPAKKAPAKKAAAPAVEEADNFDDLLADLA